MCWILALCLLADTVRPVERNLSDLGVYSDYLVYAVSENGSLLLVDVREDALHFLDANLKTIRSLNQKGQGPEEVDWITGAYWDLEQKRFCLFDRGNGRVTLWNEQGEHLGVQPYPWFDEDPKAGPDGTYFYIEQFPDRQYKSILYQVDGKKRERRQLHLMDLSRTRRFTKLPHPSRPTPMLFHLDWEAYMRYDLGSDFLVVNNGDGDLLTLMDFQGKVVGEIRTSLPQLPVTDQQVEAVIERLPRHHHNPMKKHIAPPGHWPVVREILVDGADRIWVFGQQGLPGRPFPYKRYNRSGVLESEGVLDQVPLHVGSNVLYFLRENEDEEMILEKRFLH